MSSRWPAIPEPYDVAGGLYPAVLALKESVELLTGQRGDLDSFGVDERIFQLEQQVDNALARIIVVNEVYAAKDIALAQRTTILEARVDGAMNGLVDTNARITQVERAYADADEAIALSVETLEAHVDSRLGGIETDVDARFVQEQQARATTDSALAQQITTLEATLTTTINNNKVAAEASIVEEQTARVTATTALAQEITNLNTSLTTVINGNKAELEALIANEQTARISATGALAQDITNLEVSLTTSLNGAKVLLQANIDSEARARVDADGAMAQTVTSLAARLDTADQQLSASLVDEQNVRISQDNLLVQSLQSLDARLGQTNANVAVETQARIANDGSLQNAINSHSQQLSFYGGQINSLASQTSTLQTQMAGNTAVISQNTSSINGLYIRHGINGYINGQTGGYVFTGVLKLDGTVQYLMEFWSSVTIYGDLIVEGSLNSKGIAQGAISAFAGTNGYLGPGQAWGVWVYVKQGGYLHISAAVSEYYGYSLRTINPYQQPSNYLKFRVYTARVFGSVVAAFTAWDAIVESAFAFDANFNVTGAINYMQIACMSCQGGAVYGPLSEGSYYVDLYNQNTDDGKCHMLGQLWAVAIHR
jgi:hypothetical protein